MTIQDLLDQGICIEGSVKITSWDYEEEGENVHYDGQDIREVPQEFRNRDIRYIFPFCKTVTGVRVNHPVTVAGICIEVEAEE